MNTSESRGSSRLRTPFLNLTLKDDAWWGPAALLTPCRSVAGLPSALRRGTLCRIEPLCNLNYAQIHFASVAAFVAGWRSS